MMLSDKATYKVFKRMLHVNKYKDTFNNDSSLLGFYRLLDVSKELILPVKTHINILLASNDVLHIRVISLSETELDVWQGMLEICPGRLNDFAVHINSEDTFYGCCSEFCGKNHRFTAASSYNIDMYVNVVNLKFSK